MIEPNTVQTQQSMAFPPLAGFEGSAQALLSTTKTAEQSIAVMLGNPATAANKSSADLGAVTGMIQAFTELVGKLVDLIASFAKMKGDTSDASKSSTPTGQSQSSTNPSTTANAASGGSSGATPGSTAGSTSSAGSTSTPATTSTAGSTTGTTGSSSAAAPAPATAGTQVGGGCGCPKADAAPATTTTTPTATPASAPTTAPADPATGRKAPDAGKLLGASGQFLWKPVSEKDGKLAVLLPPNLAGKVKDVMVISPDKKTILAKGRYAGVGNGDRDHFRFLKAGGEFPDGAVVLIRLKNGESRHVVIKESSARATR